MKTKVISLNVAACAKQWQVDTWQSRQEKILDAVTVKNIGIVLIQESGPGQYLKDLDATLGRKGLVRVRGGGRWRHIYIDPKKFKVIKSGLFALNKTFSKHAAWAILECKKTGQRLFVVSSHLTSGSTKQKVRAKEAKTLIKKVTKKNKKRFPEISGGDFNAADKFVKQEFVPSGYKRTSHTAKRGINLKWNTYGGWNIEAQKQKKNPKTGVHLSHILLRGNIKAVRLKVRKAHNAASDHLPILLVARY